MISRVAAGAQRGLRAGVLAVAALALLVTPAAAADQIQLLAGFDSGVTEITPPTADGVRYLGGSFRRFNSYDTGYAAVFDATSGAINTAFPNVNGIIYAAIPDGAGGFYIGGSFSCVGTDNGDGDCADAGENARSGLAQINADGTVSAWNPGVSGGMSTTVKALVLSGTTLYVGGSFTTIGGQSRASIAAVSTTANTGNATAWNPGVSGSMVTVNALVLSGTTLYVGGSFTTIGGQSRANIAAVSTTTNTGNATAWNPGATSAMFTEVMALAQSGTTLYVGGSFTSLGGAPRSNIGALSTGSNTAMAWNPGAGARVRALAVRGTTVYAGGDFQTIGGASRNRIAALDATTATNNATAWDPNANGQVFGLLLVGTTLYIGGYFDQVDGLLRPGIALLDTTVTTGIVTSWAPVADGAWAIATAGSLVFAGGNFREAGGLPREHLAAMDAGGHLTAWDPNANNSVTSIRVRGSTIFVAGDFTTIGGVARNGLAAVDTAGTVLPWNPAVVGGGTHVIEVVGDKLLIGGYFTSVGGVARTNLAMISLAGSCATTFTSACVTSWNPPTTNTVNAMDGADVDAIAVTGSTAVIGGRFTEVDGDARRKLAALSVSDACAISYSKAACLLAWNPQGDGGVKAIAISGDTAYVGGEFTTMAGSGRTRIAALDVGTACRAAWSNGTCLLSGWNPGASGSVVGLAIDGTTLYAGGAFTTFGGATRNHIGAISIGSADSCATTFVAGPCLLSWNPNTDGQPSWTGQVEAVDAAGGTVLFGGYFLSVGGTARRYLASVGVDGTLGTAIPSGMLPGAPTAVAATVTGDAALVTFTPPSSAGTSAITSYTATCASSSGGAARTASGATSPLAVSSLTVGATYTCSVTATSTAGTGPASTATSAFTVGGGSDTGADAGAGGATVVATTAAASASAGAGADSSSVGTRHPATIRQTVTGERRLVVRVRVASAGVLRVVGTMTATRRATRAAGIVVCTATRQVTGPGVPWVACGLSPAVQLRRESGAVRITLAVTFRPAAGGPVQRSTQAVLLSRRQEPSTPLLG